MAFPESDQQLGKRESVYQSNRVLFAIFMGVGVFFMLGGLSMIASSGGIGVMVIILGLIFAIFALIKYPIWSAGAVYDKGIIIKRWGKNRPFAFEDLDGYHVVFRPHMEVGNVGVLGAVMANYQRQRPQRYFFYRQGKVVLNLGSPSFNLFGGWQDVGDALMGNIRKRQLEVMKAKLEQGEKIVIDTLVPASMKNIAGLPFTKRDKMLLTLSPEGIQVDDQAVIAWKDAEMPEVDFDGNVGSMRSNGGKGFTFLRLGSVNSLIIEAFLREQIAAHKH